jgi:hypothetical protein
MPQMMNNPLISATSKPTKEERDEEHRIRKIQVWREISHKCEKKKFDPDVIYEHHRFSRSLRPDYWMSHEGMNIPISELDTDHLENIILMVNRWFDIIKKAGYEVLDEIESKGLENESLLDLIEGFEIERYCIQLEHIERELEKRRKV